MDLLLDQDFENKNSSDRKVFLFGSVLIVFLASICFAYYFFYSHVEVAQKIDQPIVDDVARKQENLNTQFEQFKRDNNLDITGETHFSQPQEPLITPQTGLIDKSMFPGLVELGTTSQSVAPSTSTVVVTLSDERDNNISND